MFVDFNNLELITDNEDINDNNNIYYLFDEPLSSLDSE